MARFELTMGAGEKILVDHSSDGMSEILTELTNNAFVLYTEVSAAASAAPRQIIIATGQIVLIRPLDGLTTQSTTFRPKR